MIKPFSKEEVLELIPQAHPFRFVDSITELDENHIVGRYRFRPDEFFYKGHFPGKPLTPGVILLETMAQVGVVAFGLYLLSLESEKEQIEKYLSIFTDAEVEFFLPVLPGDEVTIRAEKVFWRKKKLKSKVEMLSSEGKLIASSIVSGLGVLR